MEPDALRRYIEGLERWTIDNPPSRRELQNLDGEIPLSQEERNKLETLALKHRARGHKALREGFMNQAVAEMERALQLRPWEIAIRIELAEFHLQRAMRREHGKRDRERAFKLAETARAMNPKDPSVQRFFREHRRRESIRPKRRLILLASLLLLALLGFWLRWDWVIALFDGPEPTIPPSPIERPVPMQKTVAADLMHLEESGLETELTSVTVGRRNDGSYVLLEGKLSPGGDTLGTLILELRGRDVDGRILFRLPWEVRGSSDGFLEPGDTQALFLFRWLGREETNIDLLELTLLEMETRIPGSRRTTEKIEVVWRVPRPEGVVLEMEIRNKTLVEAYDRQVLLLELAVSYNGNTPLTFLEGRLVPGGVSSPVSHIFLTGWGPPPVRGETRVETVSLSLPLHAMDGPITVEITEAAL